MSHVYTSHSYLHTKFQLPIFSFDLEPAIRFWRIAGQNDMVRSTLLRGRIMASKWCESLCSEKEICLQIRSNILQLNQEVLQNAWNLCVTKSKMNLNWWKIKLLALVCSVDRSSSQKFLAWVRVNDWKIAKKFLVSQKNYWRFRDKSKQCNDKR